MKFYSIDLERNGLTGQFLSCSIGLYDGLQCIASVYAEFTVTEELIPWVKENVVTLYGVEDDLQMPIEDFLPIAYRFLRMETDAPIVFHMGYPVEYDFLTMVRKGCCNDDQFQMPYMYLDLNAMLHARGYKEDTLKPLLEAAPVADMPTTGINYNDRAINADQMRLLEHFAPVDVSEAAAAYVFLVG
jgi:hypothetical protein